MRTLHRLCSILALFVMLYLGVTGSLIQILDLHAILTHAPETDPTMTSIDEGKEGDGNFAVRSRTDLYAQPLPQTLDYTKAFATILHALHTQQPQAQIRFAELRMSGNHPIGQIATGPIGGYPQFHQNISAFNPFTGAPEPAVRATPAQPLPSLREKIKEWHRFFTRSFAGGTWLETIAGLLMWTMIVTGLTFYCQQLANRRAIGRTQWFWKSGGPWRTTHRWLSLIAAIFLIALAFTGTWIGAEGTWHGFQPDPPNDFSSPMTDAQVQQQAQATLRIFRAAELTTPIKVLRVRLYSNYPQGVIITGGNLMIGGETTRQLVYNTRTGQRMSLTEPGYAPNQWPFGTQTHENIKHLHSGFSLGTWSRFFYLFAGLSLIYLSCSGLVMYFSLWRARAQTGRPSPVWL